MKQWKIFHGDSCPICGDGLEVLSEFSDESDTDFESTFGDGEEVRCSAECGFESALSCDGETCWVQDGNRDEIEELEEQKEHFKSAKYRMKEEGFHQCFTDYSNWDEIKDEEFHKLRKSYLDSAEALKKYINEKAQ